MKTHILFLVGLSSILVFGACTTKKYNIVAHPLYSAEVFDIDLFSADHQYAFTEKKAVKVGGAKRNEGPRNERRYLNALAGPNGEQVHYYRLGSTSVFKSPNGFDGIGVLDAYHVFYLKAPGDTVKNTIYINMYDMDKLYIPIGFTKKYKD